MYTDDHLYDSGLWFIFWPAGISQPPLPNRQHQRLHDYKKIGISNVYKVYELGHQSKRATARLGLGLGLAAYVKRVKTGVFVNCCCDIKANGKHKYLSATFLTAPDSSGGNSTLSCKVVTYHSSKDVRTFAKRILLGIQCHHTQSVTATNRVTEQVVGWQLSVSVCVLFINKLDLHICGWGRSASHWAGLPAKWRRLFPIVHACNSISLRFLT